MAYPHFFRILDYRGRGVPSTYEFYVKDDDNHNGAYHLCRWGDTHCDHPPTFAVIFDEMGYQYTPQCQLPIETWFPLHLWLVARSNPELPGVFRDYQQIKTTIYVPPVGMDDFYIFLLNIFQHMEWGVIRILIGGDGNE